MKNGSVNISIVTYKEDPLVLKEALVSCSGFSGKGHIYLIDHSPGNSLQKEIESFPKVRYVFNPENPGYGAGHNSAIKRSMDEGAKYHVVMNPDIYFEKDVIETIAGFMDENENIGMLMPKILFPNGQLQYLCKLLPTPFDLIFRRFIPGKKWKSERNNIYELRFTKYNRTMRVPCLSGCFMVLRTSVLEKSGVFDEKFFMYLEDVDLCRRVGAISDNIYFPDAVVYHQYKKGSYKKINLLIKHIASAIKYFNKWGWITDHDRKKINCKTLKILHNRIDDI